MVIDKHTLTIAGLVIISLPFIAAQCNKSPGDCITTKFSFELPVKAYPDRDTLAPGDTIFLEINEPTSFKDIFTGNIINYSEAVNLGSAIGFQKYDTLNKNWINAAEKFSFTLRKGLNATSSNMKLYREYLFVEENNSYLFNLLVIPESSGLFRLVLSNSGNTLRSSDKCTKANFIINFKDTNHNRHLVGNSDNDTPGGDLNFYVK